MFEGAGIDLLSQSQAAAAPSMSDALTQSMKKLAEKKDFVFEENMLIEDTKTK